LELLQKLYFTLRILNRKTGGLWLYNRDILMSEIFVEVFTPCNFAKCSIFWSSSPKLLYFHMAWTWTHCKF